MFFLAQRPYLFQGTLREQVPRAHVIEKGSKTRPTTNPKAPKTEVASRAMDVGGAFQVQDGGIRFLLLLRRRLRLLLILLLLLRYYCCYCDNHVTMSTAFTTRFIQSTLFNTCPKYLVIVFQPRTGGLPYLGHVPAHRSVRREDGKAPAR